MAKKPDTLLVRLDDGNRARLETYRSAQGLRSLNEAMNEAMNKLIAAHASTATPASRTYNSDELNVPRGVPIGAVITSGSDDGRGSDLNAIHGGDRSGFDRLLAVPKPDAIGEAKVAYPPLSPVGLRGDEPIPQLTAEQRLGLAPEPGPKPVGFNSDGSPIYREIRARPKGPKK